MSRCRKVYGAKLQCAASSSLHITEEKACVAAVAPVSLTDKSHNLLGFQVDKLAETG